MEVYLVMLETIVDSEIIFVDVDLPSCLSYIEENPNNRGEYSIIVRKKDKILQTYDSDEVFQMIEKEKEPK